jgi:uncharacterized protein
VLHSLRPQNFTDERFGLPTVTDILAELDKPGRDPRPAFITASFAEGVETLDDLAPGMILEGVVTNVAAFGAFIDIGVHQDGLVHVSAMSHDYISDPRAVARSGDVVRVKVLAVDTARKRISLTMRLDDEPDGTGGSTRDSQRPAPGDRQPDSQSRRNPRRGSRTTDAAPGGRAGDSRGGGTMADALKRAGLTADPGDDAGSGGRRR